MQRVRSVVESPYFVPVVLAAGLLLRLLAVARFQVAPISDFVW